MHRWYTGQLLESLACQGACGTDLDLALERPAGARKELFALHASHLDMGIPSGWGPQGLERAGVHAGFVVSEFRGLG